jgi:hypothetical protein
MDRKVVIGGIVLVAIFYYFLKYHIEPWVIEIMCRELIKCAA